jgi:hypothetical protein
VRTHAEPSLTLFAMEWWCVSWRMFHPDDRPMAHDECPMAISLKERATYAGPR